MEFTRAILGPPDGFMRRAPAAEPIDQFIPELFPAELEEICARRQAADLAPLPEAARPSVEVGLVGLALSGGGIRSATFSLGVIQGLARRRILRAVDYLSTVSGGGFIGSAVSSLLNDPAVEPDGPTFPLRSVVGEPDPPAVRHLRNSERYLAPDGLIDRLRLPALMLRGMTLNFVMIVPYVMLLVSLTDLIYSLLPNPRRFFLSLSIIASAAFIGVAITYPFVIRLVGRRMTWPDRDNYERTTALVFLAAGVSLLLMPVFSLVDESLWMQPSDLLQMLPDAWGQVSRWALPATFMVGAAWLLAGQWPAAKRLRSTLALYAIGALGPAVPLALYLILCIAVIDPPGTLGVAHDTKRPATIEETNALNSARIPESLIGVPVARSDDTTPAAMQKEAAVRVIEPGWLWHVITEGRHLIVSSEPILRLWAEAPHDDPRNIVRAMEWPFLGAAIAWWLLGVVFLNVNASSAHGFYRDRLSRAYLIRRAAGEAESFASSDSLKLSELGRPGTRAPFHLVNASLNLNGTADLDVRGRNCDFFVFSKRYTGSARLGYASTKELEGVHPHLNLGTAMAISGAAASPNAGVATIAPLAFIQTLLDVRLGYWLPSPAALRCAGLWQRLRLWLGTGPSYLLREAFQQVSSGGSFVNLSDGGHIENLAIYQLLRRRCRLIIAVDGEQDGAMVFDGLMRLLLYARIDLGVDIEIDLSALRPDESDWSRRHYAIGTIVYGTTPDGQRETGTLLYLKASMTGDEDEIMRDYRRLHPAFPHEPTSNQFFNERQWEMYRDLGQHVVDHAFDDADDRMRAIRDELASLLTPAAMSEPAVRA